MSNTWINEEKIDSLVKAFHKLGFEIYAVGGCVRDLLMHRHPKDIDFCTNASVEQMYSVLRVLVQEQHEDCYIIPVGEKYGTCAFHFVDGGQYEVTQYRKDGVYLDGRHPNEVIFASSIEEDLSRRDFTCNAMAMDWETKEIIDPFGGVEDIKNKLVRCVGNPEERFEEDALRILRLLRFAVTYNFEIDSSTGRAALYMVDSINKVSKERLGSELTKIFSTHLETVKSFSAQMLLVDVLYSIFPTFNGTRNEVFDKIVSDKVPLLRWYDCCPSENGKKATSFISKFAVGSEITDGIKHLEKALNSFATSTVVGIRMLDIVRTEEERKAFFSWLIKNGYDVTAFVEAIVNDRPYSLRQLAIDGNYIIHELGVTDGKEISKLLEIALNYVCIFPEKNNEKDINVYLTTGKV